MAAPTQQQIQDWLDEAREALQALLVGRARIGVRQRDRAIEYKAAEEAALRARIAELEGMLDGAPPAPSSLFSITQTGNGYE